MPPKEKIEKTDTVKNVLAALLNGYKDDHFNFIQNEPKRISTGSLLLNQSVELNSGSVLRLCGPTSAGKTSEAFLICQNFLNTMPNSRALYIKAEARLSTNIQKRVGLKFTTNAEEWDVGTVFVLECNVFETVAETIKALLKEAYNQGQTLCIILDSLDGLILKNDRDTKAIGEAVKVAGTALLTKLMFKQLGLPINKYNALLIVTSQVTAHIKLDPYAKEAPRVIQGSGGNALNHQADYILEFQPRYNSDYICENPNEKPSDTNPIVGHWCNIKILKSATETDGQTISVPIKRGRVGNAIWLEKEVVDYLMSNSLITKKGAWFKVDDNLRKQLLDKVQVDVPEQIQGMASVYEFFEKNPPAVNYLSQLFQK